MIAHLVLHVITTLLLVAYMFISRCLVGCDWQMDQKLGTN
jgi:hypothetical protein